MIVNEVITGVVAITIAYLLGSIPTVYIVTRLFTGKDIRKLGGGNVGARNTFVEIGKAAGAAVAIFDVGKGVAAVVIALKLMDLSLNWVEDTSAYFVLGAGVAVVAGHMWPIYLKFRGGNGLAATIGALSILLTRELVIALALTIALVFITRNLVLGVNLSLLSVPLTTWYLEQSGLLVVFTMLIAVMLVVNFLPTARAALAKAGSKENLSAELLRRDRAKQKGKKK